MNPHVSAMMIVAGLGLAVISLLFADFGSFRVLSLAIEYGSTWGIPLRFLLALATVSVLGGLFFVIVKVTKGSN